MSTKPLSIRKRFIVLISVLGLLVLAVALYVEKAATATVDQSVRLSHDQRELSWALSALSDSLHRTGVAIYQASFFNEDFSPDLLQVQLDQLRTQITALSVLPAVRMSNEFLEPTRALQQNVNKLVIEAHSLLDLQRDVEQRYPAMPVMLNELQPTNREFTTALTEALDEAQHSSGNKKQAEVHKQLIELRYLWAQLISSVRVFVANRLGAFGPPSSTMKATENDRQLYATEVMSILSALQKEGQNGNLGFVQEDSVKRMIELAAKYEKYFQIAAEIYYSKNWRADQHILKDGIDPLLNQAWTQIYLLQDRLNAMSQQGMSDSAATTDTVSNVVWMLLGIVYFLLIFAYVTFEYIIRRPIAQVAKALEAEGRGESYEPHTPIKVEETSALISAFSSMKEQVRSRQARLQAILDNAGEGILTITEKGTVESINIAAEQLFGYTESNIVGSNASFLLSSQTTQKYEKDLLAISKNPQHEVFQHEHEVFGRRKNGTVFPMSIRLGRVELDGRILFTALVSDISERKALMDRLTHLAERDSLTGLYNRHYLMDELERIVEREARSGKECVALLYIDLDNFKFVNDTIGHMAGDNVLKEVTSVLRNRARGSDLLARLGGDEFSIILYDVNEAQVRIAADHYRRQLAEYVFRYEGSGVDIGCSIGIALLEDEISTKEEWLSRADLACHLAKRQGRNRIYLYQKEDQHNLDSMSTDMGWARRIKQSIERDHFVIACQPIQNTVSGRISSYEVLLRMPDDNGELMLPSGFLSSADRFGLSVEIDRWVIRHSIRQLARRSCTKAVSYSINLSPKSIGDASILKLIQEELENTDIDTSSVVFEITETGAIANVAAAVTFLKELRALGFKTALDDFGVGYSSFSYLKDFPVDYVKIDGSFVRGACLDKVKQAIIKSMNEVAHALGKQTVAEFVEDEETYRLLGKIGVDFCQGYYIGKPDVYQEKISNVVYLH